MIASKTKKTFKLNVLGLFKWESEGWEPKEVALILALVMVFIMIIIMVLKLYAIPTLGVPVLANKIGIGIAKIFKIRAP